MADTSARTPGARRQAERIVLITAAAAVCAATAGFVTKACVDEGVITLAWVDDGAPQPKFERWIGDSGHSGYVLTADLERGKPDFVGDGVFAVEKIFFVPVYAEPNVESKIVDRLRTSIVVPRERPDR